MSEVTANDLKTKGVSSLEAALSGQSEAIISVRGKPRYVVMDIAQYERLREAEIFSAWQDARMAESSGDYSVETAEEHIKRLKKELASDAV
jgi:prevent-host-death family protein